MEQFPLCQPLDLGDLQPPPGGFQPFSKATAGCRGRQCLLSAGESPGAASPLHSQPASLPTQKRKNLPLSSEGDVMTEAKVAEPGRKQETTPQHGRMNLRFGAPLPSQNGPFFWAAVHPRVPFPRELGLRLRPFASPGCSGAKLQVVPKAPPWPVLLWEGFFSLTLMFLLPWKGFFSLTLVVLLPWEGFFRSLWCFWHHFHMCQEPCPLILPEHPQSFSSLARGHPRAGCSFLASLHLTAGNPQIWGPTSSCCPHVYPKPMRPAAKSPPSATFDG